jgi:glycosyltransferase involved in cell wall biosynthesis
MAGSILRAVDLPQLIANDTDDYQARAIALANDRPQIEAMKKQLVDNRLSCTLFDTPKFVRDLEALFEKIALKGSASAHTDKKTSKKPVGKTTQKRVAAPTLVPRVSILMPTHNQPEQLDIALKSALVQKYTNLEIIISDTSEDDTTERQLAALIKADARVRYSRSRKMSVSAHRTHCLALSSGDFVNFLLNDDVFDGEKIAQMSGYLMQQPNAGMITSFQSMVDADGRVQQIPGSAPIFATQTVVGGISLGDLMLGNANNILGAPSAILFRREHMTENYGMFAGQRYDALADVATWLSILSSKDCVYLPQALSSFQLSTELAARAHAASIEANVEWLQLYCAAHLKNKFMFNSPVFYAQLTTKLTGTISYLASVREDIKAGAFNIETLHQLIRQATTILLTK